MSRVIISLVVLLAAALACESEPPPETPPNAAGALGAHFTDGGFTFTLKSTRATRVHLELFDRASGAAATRVVVMDGPDDDGRFFARVNVVPPVLYGYRVFGPNWPFDERWVPGSEAGFVSDVDDVGNRMNPNKLLSDPYGRELSHDPLDLERFTSGEQRAIDTAPFAPKSVALAPLGPAAPGPERALLDDVVYEVHVKGFTRNDPSLPEDVRGTYLGAGMKAAYLRELGVTAVEFLPLHEAPNDQNDIDPESAFGDNYWGYNSLSFFSPDRRYAHDQSLGGPTRELQEMVSAFHREGIKVFMDVVYNHTAESHPYDEGRAATLLSWRGVDNAGYYQLDEEARFYADHNGVGPNLSAQNDIARDLVIDSMRYFSEVIGVDGYRVDLAALHGNRCPRTCFSFDNDDPDGILVRATRELDVDLLAEPWGAREGTYQLGNFPEGWAMWNDRFRDAFRKDLNRLGVDTLPLSEVATRASGSSDLFRAPGESLNFVTSHDGFTLMDLVSCNEKHNDQPWPLGPSDGGSDNNLSYDHAGDRALQRQVARTLMALTVLSSGTPMLLGGDERFRQKGCNNNTYNLDNEATGLSWSLDDDERAQEAFTRGLLALRRAHPTLARPTFYSGIDAGSGIKDITWLHDSGVEAWDEVFTDPELHFLAWRVESESGSLYVGYNGWRETVSATLPAPRDGMSWRVVLDTGRAREPANAELDEAVSGTVDVEGLSLVVLEEL